MALVNWPTFTASLVVIPVATFCSRVAVPPLFKVATFSAMVSYRSASGSTPATIPAIALVSCPTLTASVAPTPAAT